jgi:hypothetical protein
MTDFDKLNITDLFSFETASMRYRKPYGFNVKLQFAYKSLSPRHILTV